LLAVNYPLDPDLHAPYESGSKTRRSFFIRIHANPDPHHFKQIFFIWIQRCSTFWDFLIPLTLAPYSCSLPLLPVPAPFLLLPPYSCNLFLLPISLLSTPAPYSWSLLLIFTSDLPPYLYSLWFKYHWSNFAVDSWPTPTQWTRRQSQLKYLENL